MLTTPPPQGNYTNNYQYREPVVAGKYVNICMVTYNRLEYTKQAVAALVKYTCFPHVITVVDNNSQDGTREHLTLLHWSGVIKNLVLLDENVGVAKASNLAWHMEPNAAYYMKLDNDIVIEKPDWLTNMIEIIDAIPQAGAVGYSFEPSRFPLTTIDNMRVRIKNGIIGGACIIIPKRTEKRLGYWCEDYGLYGEEDADYGHRIVLAGLLNVYMEDENIGVHFPAGRAARIDPVTFAARDGAEEKEHEEYRRWKDEQRRKNAAAGGVFSRNLQAYNSGLLPLYRESSFVKKYFSGKDEYERLGAKAQKKKASVSIIIPVFNKPDYTKQCLDALAKNTPQGTYEILVVDNASTDGTRDFLKQLPFEAKIITNEKNLGFARACNLGAKAAATDYLLFLNNDTEPQPGWFEPLLKVVDTDTSVVAVGSKLLFPDGTIQHAGIIIVDDKANNDPLLARNNHVNKPAAAPEANETTLYQALTAACVLIRKAAFDKVEGFDEEYWNGYEDVDLCFKLQEQGGKLVYQPASIVIHHESKSGTERFAKAQENIARLHGKWLGKITPDIILNKNGLNKNGLNQNGEVILTHAGKISPYHAPEATGQSLTPTASPIQPNLVSIVILVHNQLPYTQICLDHLFRYTPEPFELIVVDNGSTDGTKEYLNSLRQGKVEVGGWKIRVEEDGKVSGEKGEETAPRAHQKKRKNRKEKRVNVQRSACMRFEVVQNKENLGFAAGNNQGMAIAKGDYILLMNNDVVVTPGWLGFLFSCAEQRSKIGIVGPMTNYISGPQRVEKVAYDIDSLTHLNQFSQEVHQEHRGQCRSYWRVVGFFMLIKRAVVETIGGLDERYGLGNFEDDDFCLRAALAGFESWIAQDCFVHHFGSRTFIGARIDLRESLHKNWEIFKKKWGIPSGVAYGTPYDMAQVLRQGFDPIKHYCPLNRKEYSISDGEALFAKGEMERAKEIFEQILYLDGNNTEALNNRGVIAFHQGEIDQAMTYFKRVLEMDPAFYEAPENLGKCMVANQKYEEALHWFRRALELKPDDVDILNALANCFIQIEDFTRGEETYSRSCQLDRNQPTVGKILAELEKMKALQRQRRITP
ncbi:MAG: glycosyltransferase [Deltaproteobacteria bacterium]